jgi:hypothetical protein
VFVRFWLGVHRPNWLPLTDVGVMVSHRTMRARKTLPRALGPWVLDSGGFTALNTTGRWDETADEYVRAVERYTADIGGLVWASPQDWMCEPRVLRMTGKTVDEHQRLTVENFLALDGRGPFIPVLQGWEPGDYFAHVEMYERAGVDLRARPLVGLGSVCRRQATREIALLVDQLATYGLRLHGYGVKRGALRTVGQYLTSADSMAWSYNARREPPLNGCDHASCRNCLRYALQWRTSTLRALDVQQLRLFTPEGVMR